MEANAIFYSLQYIIFHFNFSCSLPVFFYFNKLHDYHYQYISHFCKSMLQLKCYCIFFTMSSLNIYFICIFLLCSTYLFLLILVVASYCRGFFSLFFGQSQCVWSCSFPRLVWISCCPEHCVNLFLGILAAALDVLVLFCFFSVFSSHASAQRVWTRIWGFM